ncbi:MAG: SAM-dependent methyltransferase [Desulfobacterales bacterium]|nr:SAM-dependent methyltransferase [Desulfobacterales bacterium]
MTLSVPRIRQYLQTFALEKLFIEELGWDRHSVRLSVQVDGQAHSLTAFAEKRGVQIFECQPYADGKIPDYATRRKIEKQVTKSAYEHLIIFADAERGMQIWQWVSRQPGQPARYREHHYHPGHQSGGSLIQKLESISFPLSQEEGLTLTGVAFGLRDAFDRDRVTKRFYDLFKKQHTAFLNFVKGITEQGDREWYASLMLNRLMFIYFIQRKGFLDGDVDYLRNRLKVVQERKGKDKFLTFYRYFLLRLFHEGFGQQPTYRAPDLEELLGQVPYLNGGLFELHELEEKYPEIDIPDKAFEKLFAFFDQYEWHLDNRPLRNDREINPDVLGYIFEKYINQKQMGAYYTKEDITEYISKNTIIPHLFDTAKKKCAIAFEPGSALWKLLQEDPDRYIYPAVRKGVIDEHGEVIPLPPEVAAGIEDISQRHGWNQAADPEFALPTETWREYVARRQRCLEVRDKLLDGEVRDINDLITYNLDICQFAEDVISGCEGPELLRAFYKAISSVTVLDPTCGSWAFLFAALNILEPLYEACLERMHAFVDDLDRSGVRHRPEKFSDFRRTLAEIERHPNRAYFILKSIIAHNLYGVDIMPEAVEICKLRLFLKLVAQVERLKDLEPLPDIDFNIRPGNTLVGFVKREEIRQAAQWSASGKQHQGKLVFGKTKEAIDRIEEDAEIVERAYNSFQKMQTEYSMDAKAFSSQKRQLSDRLKKLTEELNQYLAREYGIDPKKPREFNKWIKSHHPFHWFVEFFGIMKKGGFDVAIGNPPYVVYSSSKVEYRVEPMGFQTLPTKNLYALVFERSVCLAKHVSPVGLIVQMTVLSSNRLPSLQDLLLGRGSLYLLPFPRRPQSMFDGVEMPVAILLSMAGPNSTFITSRLGRIYADERPHALKTVGLTSHSIRIDGHRVAKIGLPMERSIYEKLMSQKATVNNLVTKNSDQIVYYQEACRYWLKACEGVPYFKRNGKNMIPPHGRVISLESAKAAQFLFCLLNSSLFFWYYSLFSDCEHVNDHLVKNMPIPEQWSERAWSGIARRLLVNLQKHSNRKTIKTKQGHRIEYDEIRALSSKDVIDKIDSILADDYHLTGAQRDFLINFDIKYRMG